jgi:large subunit ribosomal protein L17
MKHQKKGRKFSRKANQRKALLKSLLGSLIVHEKITTTEAKAKEIKSMIDRVINQGKVAHSDKNKKIAIIRDLNKKLSPKASEKIVGEFSDKFKERKSGYVRIIKKGPRKSDSAKMAIIELLTN